MFATDLHRFKINLTRFFMSLRGEGGDKKQSTKL